CYTKLVSGQSLIDHPILDEVKIARTRHVMGHLQSQDYVFPGAVMKLYFWDQSATDFCKKFTAYVN
ncbi:hypothetical protein HID58_028282, partial [Brassica napus]